MEVLAACVSALAGTFASLIFAVVGELLIEWSLSPPK